MASCGPRSNGRARDARGGSKTPPQGSPGGPPDGQAHDRRRPHADAGAGAAAARTGTTTQIPGEPFFMDPLKRAIADAELLAMRHAAAT